MSEKRSGVQGKHLNENSLVFFLILYGYHSSHLLFALRRVLQLPHSTPLMTFATCVQIALGLVVLMQSTEK